MDLIKINKKTHSIQERFDIRTTDDFVGVDILCVCAFAEWLVEPDISES